MKPGKSILNKVIYLNLIILLIISTLFVFSSCLYSKQLAKERYNQAHATLSKLNKDFQLEVDRLDTLLTLCLQDSSLVFALSDRLDYDFFLTNASQSASRMSLMRQSLPYAKTVFLYINNSGQIVRDNGEIYTEDIFMEKVLKLSDGSHTDISALPEGLYRYNDTYALYVKKLYEYGCVAVQIDLSEFANIHKTISDDFLGYVIQNDGEQIIENTSVFLSDKQLKEALNQDFITVENTKYFCASSTMSVIPYTGLVLINNDALMQPLNYMKIIMFITFAILLASSMILILLNYKIYLPLKKFTSQFGNSTDNEIAIIENQIHELLFEINTLKEASQPKDVVPEKIALYYLISGGAQLNDATMQILENKYPYYMLMAFALQNNSGEEDLLFASSLEKELSAHFKVQFMSISKYKFAMIARPEDKENILKFLETMLCDSRHEIQLFAGIREYCVDIKELYAEYQLARNALLASPICREFVFSYSEKTALAPRRHLNTDMHQRIFEYARNQAISKLNQEVTNILYPDRGCPLSVFQSNYRELLSIFEKACASMNASWPVSFPEYEIYNTDYMYRTLTDLIQNLFAARQKQTPDMKQRMEEYILEHINEPLTLDSVADVFSITPVYLSGWFGKNMGANFLPYISAIRMEKAKEMLSQPDPPKVYEVAQAVGIENTATFIRQFKKHTGITPSQYQKKVEAGL